MTRFLKQKNKGFTLIEAMVSISLFTLSILALMSVLASSLAGTNYAKQKVIASYLGQEGIEYLRNMRDTAALYNATSGQAGWNAFKTTANGASCDVRGCYISNMALVSCNLSGVCPNLLYDSTTSTYGYTSGADSGFNRKVQVTHINANQTRVVSTVTWRQGSGTYSVVFSEILFNWIE
jgi:Tfp pilus assembly protein PilV